MPITELFVIKNDYGILSFYSELEIAKTELRNIYNKTPDYKHDDYFINIYHLQDGKYIYSKKSYSYTFDIFYLHNDS